MEADFSLLDELAAGEEHPGEELAIVRSIIEAHNGRVWVERLEKDHSYYRERHRVKPGLTGWAQVCYQYGDSLEDAYEKLEYDLYYVKNYSIFLDLLVILQTIRVVLAGQGAH